MPDRIIIEGSLIRHERSTLIAEAPLDSLSDYLVRRISTTFPVMPSHPVRYMSFDGDESKGLLLVEQAPGLRRIRMNHIGSEHSDAARQNEEGIGIWRVWFPWQYFAFPFTANINHEGAPANFVLRRTSLFWRRERYSSPDDTLHPAPIPNIYADGRICWGNTQATNTSLADRIDDYINNFTATTFNSELGHASPFSGSLTDWEENSPADDPTCWANWPIWNTLRSVTVTDITDGPLPPIAELNPTAVEVPDLPSAFSIARAREWLDGLAPGARQRIVAAVSQLDNEDRELATAAAIDDDTPAVPA